MLELKLKLKLSLVISHLYSVHDGFPVVPYITYDVRYWELQSCVWFMLHASYRTNLGKFINYISFSVRLINVDLLVTILARLSYKIGFLYKRN